MVVYDKGKISKIPFLWHNLLGLILTLYYFNLNNSGCFILCLNRYNGKTQKQLVEFVRENIGKRPHFER